MIYCPLPCHPHLSEDLFTPALFILLCSAHSDAGEIQIARKGLKVFETNKVLMPSEQVAESF